MVLKIENTEFLEYLMLGKLSKYFPSIVLIDCFRCNGRGKRQEEYSDGGWDRRYREIECEKYSIDPNHYKSACLLQEWADKGGYKIEIEYKDCLWNGHGSRNLAIFEQVLKLRERIMIH